jgi:hypothetical protein
VVEPAPGESHGVVVSAFLLVGGAEKVVEAGVLLTGEGRHPPLGPGQGVAGPAGGGEHFGDLEPVVGHREIPALDRHQRVDITGVLGEPFHDPGYPEPGPVPLVVLLPRPDGRYGLPAFFRQLAELSDPRLAQYVRVARNGIDEDVPLGVNFRREQLPSQRDRIGPRRLTSLAVQVFESAHDVGEIAGGVVELPHGLGDAA